MLEILLMKNPTTHNIIPPGDVKGEVNAPNPQSYFIGFMNLSKQPALPLATAITCAKYIGQKQKNIASNY